MSTLKQKTFHGIGWSFLESFAGSGITFLIGIILARLLSPDIFGIIGMVTIVFALSKEFIDSGFSIGLIRKLNCSTEEYNTVFYFNLIISLFFYIILFLFSPFIADFFKEPLLINIIRVLGFTIVINAISIVQRVIFTREINFKLQTKVSLISSITSGILAIILAMNGYGVWSLVIQIVAKELVNSSLLWFFSKWRPCLVFSIDVIKDLLPFSSKMLGTGLITTLTNNFYYLLIGRYFPPAMLGYYTRSEQFNAIVINNITGNIERVFFPVLSSLQKDEINLKFNFRRAFKTSFFITLFALLVLIAVAKPLILLLIGVKWEQSVIYLQLLCISSIFYPINVMNLNVLKIKGRSDLILKLQIIKILLLIPVFYVGIFHGITYMLIVRICTTLIATYLNAHYTNLLINYSIKEQIIDIWPYFKIEAFIFIVMFAILQLQLHYFILITIQLFVGLLMFFVFFERKKLNEYTEVKELLVGLLKRRFN